MSNGKRVASATGVCLALACALRIWLRPPHLWSEDCYNFADALEHFDPRNWHPQPPGYPLFVLQSKLIHLVVPSVEVTFLVGVILGSTIALLMAVLLGRDLFRSWKAGIFAALLLFVNPTFVFTGLTSTIRVYEAAIPLVVAYFCWRLWRGESRCWWMAALAFGIGAGYRPQMLAMLFPLWVWSAWRGKRSVGEFLAGAGVLALTTGAWIAVLYSRFGDWKSFSSMFTLYLNNQSRDSSLLFGASLDGWLRMLAMMLAWNGLAVVGWIVFRPFVKLDGVRGSTAFLSLWIVPTLAFHAAIHIGAADQALITIAAFCLIGGGVLAALFDRSRPVAFAGAALAVALSLYTFWKPIPLLPWPERNGLRGHLLTMRKNVADGLWETSWRCFSDVNDQSERAIAAFQKAIADRPSDTITIWNRSVVSWRKLAHYHPEQKFCLLHDLVHTDVYQVTAACWQGEQFLERYDGAPVQIPLHEARRIVWLLGADSPAKVALAGRLHSAGPGEVYWTAAEPMDLPGYRFVR